MTISTFGGTSTTGGAAVVGEMMSVPFGFSHPDYISTGSAFDPVDYPELATMFPPTFSADLWKTKSIPHMDSPGSVETMGLLVDTFTFKGDFFAIFANGQVFRTTGGDISTFAYLKKISCAGNTIARATVANDKLFVAFSTAQILYIYSDIDLASLVISGSTGMASLSVKYGNGVYVAWKAFQTPNTGYRSIDGGLSWTSFSFATPSSSVMAGVDWNGSTWLASTAFTTAGGTSTSPDGITWTSRTGPTTGSSVMRWNPALSLFVSISVGTAASYTSPNGLTWTARGSVASGAGITMDMSSNGSMILSNGQYSQDGLTWASIGTAAAALAAPMYGMVNRNRVLKFFDTTGIIIGCPNAAAVNFGQFSIATCDYTFGAGFNTPAPLLSKIASTCHPVFLQNDTTGVILSGVNPTADVITSMFYRPKISITTDGGGTWGEPMTLLVPESSYGHMLYVTPSQFIVKYLTSVNTFGLMSSTDGVTWNTSPTYTMAGFATPKFNVISVDEDIFVVYSGGTTYTIVKSSDYGQTWSSIASTQGAAAGYTSWRSGNNICLDQTIYFALDGSTSALSTAPIIATSKVVATVASPNVGLVLLQHTTAGSDMPTYLISGDNGVSWSAGSWPKPITNIKSAMYCGGYFIVFTSNSQYYYSTDAVNWSMGFTGDAISDVPFTWTSFNVVNGIPYLGGSGDDQYRVGDTTTYRVPAVSPTAVGSKWVVKAR